MNQPATTNAAPPIALSAMTRYLGTFSMSVAIANTAPSAMPRMNAMSPSSLPIRPHRLEPMMNPTVPARTAIAA